jgi:hypothetical protein
MMENNINTLKVNLADAATSGPSAVKNVKVKFQNAKGGKGFTEKRVKAATVGDLKTKVMQLLKDSPIANNEVFSLESKHIRLFWEDDHGTNQKLVPVSPYDDDDDDEHGHSLRMLCTLLSSILKLFQPTCIVPSRLPSFVHSLTVIRAV